MRVARRLAIAALALLAIGASRVQSPPAQPPFFFVQFSDPQLGFFANNASFEQETANFEFAVANVNRLKPAFLVITGDLVNKAGDAAQMAEYERIKAKVLPGIPVYQMPGNHDVQNAPTSATVAAYRARFGPDHYTFRYQNLLGIVLDSTIITAPDAVQPELAEQQAWLASELAKVKTSGAAHVIVFQHHPWFLSKADEDDTAFNIPKARRAPLLAMFREAGITTLVSGHYHQNAVATDAGFEAITTGPVGRPTGRDGSGFRVFLVTDAGITHQYYEFGHVPTALVAPPPVAPGPNPR